MPPRSIRIAFLSLLAAACVGPPLPPAPPMDAGRIAGDVAWLADDARGGRGAGSEGLEAAAGYLAQGLRRAGFAPGAPDGSYLQRFEMPIAIRVARQELVVPGVEGEPFRAGRDFGAFASSSDAEVEAELVFAGYGITAPHHGWDDYQGIDVRGRIVLVLDDRPPRSPLGKPRGARFLLRSEKIANARRHGAAALLLVPAATESVRAAGEVARDSANPTTRSSGIPALWLSRAAAERIAARAGGLTLAGLQAEIDDWERPASRRLGVRVALAVAIERQRGSVANVIGLRPGADPELQGEAVVIGAHYDHLGRGPFGSLSPERAGEIHNGADDNASGSAGLLELARAFAVSPPSRRSLVLVAFAGEELGLAGSRAYVEEPPVPLEHTVAMLNLDMIGRLRAGELSVFGTETSHDFPELVERAAAGSSLRLRLGQGGFAPSDQTQFYARGVPVLLFFTGTHRQYHTPDDDAELVNAAGEARVLGVVYRTARALLDADARPELREVSGPAEPSGGVPGYGPYLGTVPDFVATPGPGVRIQAVRPGSPAELAGLRAGDRIVEFDGASVANLEEFAALLFASRSGERVEIVVLRGAERLALEATLGRRR